MLFNSFQFACFLPVVFAVYWCLSKENVKWQNMLLLVASYFFYACWDYRFLFLLVFSTVLDYYTGIKMEQSKTPSQKKFWFWLSVSVNLGFLAVFKYYNFFIESFSDSLSLLGWKVDLWTLNVLLPVGISFYTFHGLSYVIDIYNGKIKADRNFIDYSLFVSFFPLLVAGPIERATHLLPQLKTKRDFNYTRSVDGLRQILWGLFKKVVIADNCAGYVNQVFDDASHHTGSTLFIAASLFAVQIYCDFSGYSDIALGTARLFGIELIRNFNFPYFSRDIAEFWRRWHISLTTWFRDYVYIPLGGNKFGILKSIRNTLVVFLISGFWHGASWTFILWGLFNALCFIPLLLLNKNRSHLDTVAEGHSLPSLKELAQLCFTFVQVTIGWIFFRSSSVSEAFEIIVKIFSSSILTPIHAMEPKIWLLVLVFFIVEWIQRKRPFALDLEGYRIPKLIRWSIYILIILALINFEGAQQEFIYFQF